MLFNVLPPPEDVAVALNAVETPVSAQSLLQRLTPIEHLRRPIADAEKRLFRPQHHHSSRPRIGLYKAGHKRLDELLDLARVLDRRYHDQGIRFERAQQIEPHIDISLDPSRMMAREKVLGAFETLDRGARIRRIISAGTPPSCRVEFDDPIEHPDVLDALARQLRDALGSVDVVPRMGIEIELSLDPGTEFIEPEGYETRVLDPLPGGNYVVERVEIQVFEPGTRNCIRSIAATGIWASTTAESVLLGLLRWTPDQLASAPEITIQGHQAIALNTPLSTLLLDSDDPSHIDFTLSIGAPVDVIVVGSGAGGCVVASRLAERDQRVLVLEAMADEAIEEPRQDVRVPLLAGRLSDLRQWPKARDRRIDPGGSNGYLVQHHDDLAIERTVRFRVPNPTFPGFRGISIAGGIPYPRGGGLGGSTRNNVMVFVRPDDNDWDKSRRTSTTHRGRRIA